MLKQAPNLVQRNYGPGRFTISAVRTNLALLIRHAVRLVGCPFEHP